MRRLFGQKVTPSHMRGRALMLPPPSVFGAAAFSQTGIPETFRKCVLRFAKLSGIAFCVLQNVNNLFLATPPCFITTHRISQTWRDQINLRERLHPRSDPLQCGGQTALNTLRIVALHRATEQILAEFHRQGCRSRRRRCSEHLRAEGQHTNVDIPTRVQRLLT